MATIVIITSLDFVTHTHRWTRCEQQNLYRLEFGVWNPKFSGKRVEQFLQVRRKYFWSFLRNQVFFETKGQLKFHAIKNLIQCSQKFPFYIPYLQQQRKKIHINTSGLIFYLWRYLPFTDVVSMWNFFFSSFLKFNSMLWSHPQSHTILIFGFRSTLKLYILKWSSKEPMFHHAKIYAPASSIEIECQAMRNYGKTKNKKSNQKTGKENLWKENKTNKGTSIIFSIQCESGVSPMPRVMDSNFELNLILYSMFNVQFHHLFSSIFFHSFQ